MSLQFFAWIIIPLIIFLLSSAIGGIVGLIRFVRTLEHSETIQKEIAKSNQNISDKLDSFIATTNGAISDHSTRLAVLEDFKREMRRSHNAREHGE